MTAEIRLMFWLLGKAIELTGIAFLFVLRLFLNLLRYAGRAGVWLVRRS